MSRETVISCDACKEKRRALLVSIPTESYTDPAGSSAMRHQEADLCHEHAIAMLQDAMGMLYRKATASTLELFRAYKFKEMD
jgi:hypothetical protein